MSISVATILALLSNAGTIEDSVTAAVAKFTTLVAATKAALPQIKAFAETLEGDAKTQFTALIAAFEDFAASAESAKTEVTATAATLQQAVNAS